MIMIQAVEGKDGKDYDYYHTVDWIKLVEMAGVTMDDGAGYPAIQSTSGVVYEVRGHSIWPLDHKWDGVVWYSK